LTLRDAEAILIFARKRKIGLRGPPAAAEGAGVMDQQKIGKYTILSQIGKGGMGVVYKAFDPTIGRTLAIKTIRFDDCGPQMAREEAQVRFLREARSIGSLSHPNIVTIYEVGEDQGMSFIAMEYVEGSSLEDLLNNGKKFSQNEAIRLIIQLADALGHAHRRDIVHRDVKPGNILIDQEGRPRLVDFGIARISASTVTKANAIMGTPHYMSPEQIRGKPVDCRADIFSVGAILYELLTSEKAFLGDQISTVIYKIVNEEPLPLRSYVKDLPSGLDAIVRKALAKDPDKRYQTCGDLIGDLTDYMRGAAPAPTIVQRTSTAPVVGETVRIGSAEMASVEAPSADAGTATAAVSRKRGFLWGGIAAAIVGLAVVAVLLWKTSTPEGPASPVAEQTRTSTEPRPTDKESVAKPALAPEDRTTVSPETHKTPNSVVVQPPAKAEARAVLEKKEGPVTPANKKAEAEVPPAVKPKPASGDPKDTPVKPKIIEHPATVPPSDAPGKKETSVPPAKKDLPAEPPDKKSVPVAPPPVVITESPAVDNAAAEAAKVLQSGIDALNRGDFDKSIAILEGVLKTEPLNTAAIRALEDAKARKAAKAREEIAARISGLMTSGRESLTRGEFRKAFEAAMSVLRLEPGSVEAQELWTSASTRLAPLEIKTAVDLYVQSFRDKTTPAYLQAHCAPELYQKIKKDIELLFSQYESFEGAASDISLAFAGGPGRLEADVNFGLFITGRAFFTGSKHALFEGIYKWRWRKTGERWIITDIQFDSVRK
jgi:serine/threonine-protein kinase